MALPVTAYNLLISPAVTPLGWETGDTRSQKAALGEQRALLICEEGRRVRRRNSGWFHQPVPEQGHSKATSLFASRVCFKQFFHSFLSCALYRIIINSLHSATIPHPGNETANAQRNVPGVQ